MSNLVVTVPKDFWLEWLAEGDCAGDPLTGEEWAFWMGVDRRPPIEPGQRLYIVAWGHLRGWAPVTRVARSDTGRWGICRHGGAQAITVPETIQGFRGYRMPWWKPEQERPFPNWKTEGVGR